MNINTVRSIRDRMRIRDSMRRVASGTKSISPPVVSLPVVNVVNTATLDIGAASGAGVEGDATTAVPPLEFGDSDLDIGAASGAGVEGDNPSILEQWRRHPNYPIGMRVAQLSTFWITWFVV